ncbi:acyl-CoA dehydrogenase family protein [Sulfitobacter porphyrae]|uniref:Acyl-CoA dehydrogenase family protein n=1 Tax=Sulfitobacter porphyrae TaxID=1246864 RepID=A0ABW2B9Y9_9RHOB
MHFDLTEDQQVFRDNVARFARSELAPEAARRARASGYPWEIAKRMAELDLMGIPLPETDGGIGGTLVDALIALQTVAEACPRSGDVIQAATSVPCVPLLNTAPQIRRPAIWCRSSRAVP